MELPRVTSRGASQIARSPLLWGCAAVLYAGLLLAAAGYGIVRDFERAGGGAAAGWDKVLHAGAFIMLGLLLGRLLALVFPGARRTVLGLFVALLGGSYAVLHEGVQLWLPGFTFSPLDLGADLLGVLTAAGLVAVSLRRPRSSVGTGAG